MSAQLEKYQYLIETLAPMAHEHDFHDLLEEKTKDCDEDIRFLLTMEIKRVAQPCILPIDLRTLVEEECNAQSIDGIVHFLSEEGKELYDYLFAFFQHYTVGVREGVITFFEKQRDIALGKTKEEKPQHEETAFSHTYISPIEQLLHYHSRHDERINHNVQVRIFLSSSVLISGSTIDISRRGLKAVLDDQTELTLIKGYRPVQVVFTGLDKSSKLHSTPIEYRIVGISKGKTQAEIHFVRQWEDGPKLFNDFLDEFMSSKKTAKLINVTNTQTAIETKIYEQAFAMCSPSVSLFMNTNKLSEPFIELACVNDSNLEILDYWQDEKHKPTIGYLFDKERLKKLLMSSDSSKSTFIYCFNHISNGKVYFYSATNYELDKNVVLKDVFLSYASRKASWRVYKLTCNQIDIEKANLPSSLPDGVSREANKSNRPLPPKVEAVLKPLSHLVTLTDITHSPGQQCYQQRELEKDKIKLLSVFGHAKNRLPESIEVYKFALFDQRKERRYQLRTDIVVGYGSSSSKGVTEDVSVQGLKLELDNTLGIKQGTLINVSFTKLQEKTREYDLQELSYKVMRISDDGYVLHLQSREDKGPKSVQTFFQMLIDKNKDKLQVLSSDASTPGLRQALRVLQARTSPQLCIYTSQQKNIHLPLKSATNYPKASTLKYLAHKMPVNYQNFSGIFNPHFQTKQLIGLLINHARKHHVSHSNEVFIHYNSSQLEHADAAICKWEQELPTHVEKYRFIKHAIANGEFFACRLTAQEPQKPITSLYEDELKYLRKGQPRLGSTLEALAWNFSGLVFLTDITEEVLYRYRLIQQ